MIDVKEHFYDDDPSKGHPDVRTRLKDVSYFFLGNGAIQAAVQVVPSGEGTPVGLLIMNPDRLGKKREALSFDPQTGLENTMIRISSGKKPEPDETRTPQGRWVAELKIPCVRVDWKTRRFQVSEYFYCSDQSRPLLIRELRIKNITQRGIRAYIQTRVLKKYIGQKIIFGDGEEKRILIRYSLVDSGNNVDIDFAPEEKISKKTFEYWRRIAKASFGSSLLDHYFNSSCSQLPAVISKAGKVDGSIWQYNREWVRDQAMMSVGLTISGHVGRARSMLNRLFEQFVTVQGDTIDSSEERTSDEVELDQNGVLLYALKNYVLWTGDFEMVKMNWEKIKVIAEFPLNDIFRHPDSGLLVNTREYWERHKTFGIEKGTELANQLWTSIGLSAAASLARFISRDSEASRWESESERIRQAFLYDIRYRLVDRRGFIKRRRVDGSIQKFIKPLPESQLPKDVPLTGEGFHMLNPDASCALPIATGFISSDSGPASATMNHLETLWNQSWKGGGYGRYHVSSEPDSPGAWVFPSLFIARAYMETRDLEKVWKILRWLNTVPGAQAGSWFEFYGERLSPPFPQVGIPPWTWAEMLILLIHHIIGVQPEVDCFRVRPRLLPGIDRIQATLFLRGIKLNLDIQSTKKEIASGFRTNGVIIQSSDKEAKISYSKKDLTIEAVI